MDAIEKKKNAGAGGRGWGGSGSRGVGSAPALCRASPPGHCAPRCPAAAGCTPGRCAPELRANKAPRGLHREAGAAAGGAGGFAAAGEGAGQGCDRPERGVGRCPAPPAAPPGLRAGTRVCVRGGGAWRMGGRERGWSPPGSPGSRGRCAEVGARGQHGVELSLGPVAPDGHRYLLSPDRPPQETPPAQRRPPLAPSRPRGSFAGRGRPSGTRALPHPSAAPAPPTQLPPGWAGLAPSPKGSGARERAPGTPASSRRWGLRGDPGRGKPPLEPSATPWAPHAPGAPRGLGEGR
jgi:hypothetical protein